MRRTAWIVGLAFGLYLAARAVVELPIIDMSDPASYRDDWGGPSLLGVLLVYVGPGLLAGAAIAWACFVGVRWPAEARFVDPTPVEG